MDYDKCAALKHELEALPEPQIVPIARFFDGNDDEGSIGCNLVPHPGIDRFKKILVDLSNRSDVRAVYALITELDPGDHSWPFSDTVIVIGTMDLEELQEKLASLQSDEVGPADSDALSPALSKKDSKEALVAWWD